MVAHGDVNRTFYVDGETFSMLAGIMQSVNFIQST